MADKNPQTVHIKDIHDLKLSKIKPQDLGNIYIDQNGQEYKLRYDAEKKKIIVVKVIKSVLDGTYIKNKYNDKIEGDKALESVFKSKMGELSKKVLQEKYQVKFEEGPLEAKPETGKKPDNAQAGQKTLTSVDGIYLGDFNDVLQVIEKIKARLEMGLKNIYESNVFNERYSYDDKIVLDEVSRLIRNTISEEFHNAQIKYEDILKGYEDSHIKSKLYTESIKVVIDQFSGEERIKFLRDIMADELYLGELGIIIKSFDDVEYKLSIIPESKINAKNFSERQKFSDAKITLNTCKNDTIKIFNFFKQLYEQKTRPPKGA